MTVEELIERLQKEPPEAIVCCSGWGGAHDNEVVEVCEAGEGWYQPENGEPGKGSVPNIVFPVPNVREA